jgi:glycosyltransferase involved in cell wall biosynthesis
MPVFNAGKYLTEAIKSILDQTFQDFELLIINDGSIDSSLDIIRSFKNKRIRIFNNKSNRGNYLSRNLGIKYSAGKYICVMDADDISLPHRFERQVLFMEQNPEFGLAGSGYRVIGRDQDLFRESEYEKIKVILIRNNCFIHPSVIIRHDFLRKSNLRYIRKYYYSSDYDFIARAARYFPITNIPEVLMHYRVHDGQVTIQHRAKQAEYANEISLEQLRYIGIDPGENEAKLHTGLLHGHQLEYSEKDKLYEWLDRIITANRKADYYKEDDLYAFFEALLSMQPFCRTKLGKCLHLSMDDGRNKKDLTDVTFVIPLRIESQQMIRNTDTVINYIGYHFNTSIYILEADEVQRYFPCYSKGNIRYLFIEDRSEAFHRTKWINRLISMATTPYIAVWDADAIAPPGQVLESVQKLRAEEAVMSLPYDGRFYSCDKVSCDLFKKYLDIQVLLKRTPVMSLIHGYHSVAGAYIVNKEIYLNTGGENENFFGWGPEDTERIKWMEIMNLAIHYSPGVMFHLWHPLLKNSWFASADLERKNHNELLKTTGILT